MQAFLKTMSTKSIAQTVKQDLCCSCGLCSNYCPKEAITYRINKLGFYEPIVDKRRCVDCGICLDSCPGKNDLKNYQNRNESYLYGYSLDDEMRINASSGGVTTELLCYLIRNKIVDYVTCVSNRVNGEKPRQVLTNNIEQIRAFRTSKYCPIDWNDVLKEIEAVDGTVAVVALPCQVNSLKQYYTRRKNRNKIKYYISLMCNHTPSLYAAEYLAKGLDNGKLVSIINRGEGFPGVMKLSLTVGLSSTERQARLPYRRTWAAGYGRYFKNMRCYVCNDPFSKNADIVMGDSYFLQDTDTQGTTFCIVRNEDLSRILEKMKIEGVIHYDEGPDKDVQKKYYAALYQREDCFPYYRDILRRIGKAINSIEPYPNETPSIKNILGFYRIVFTNSLGRYHFLWKYLAKKNNLNQLEIK